MKNKFLLLCIFLNSCSILKKVDTIYYLSDYADIAIDIKKDSTYSVPMTLSGYSEGKWRFDNNKIILHSTYQKCCIKNVYLNYDSTNVNSTCNIRISGKNGALCSTFVVMFSENKIDTFKYDIINGLNLDKKNNFKSIQILEISGVNSFAKSKIFKIKESDNLNVIVDYQNNPLRYFFFEQKIYKIKNKNILVPVNK